MRMAALLLLLLSASCSEMTGTDDEPSGSTGIALTAVASGLDSPVFLTSPAGDPRLFVVEQPGRIRIISGGIVLPLPFLDITDRVGAGGERGLLGLAFPPDYDVSGEFIVHYTNRAGNTRIERYRVTADPDVADPASARLVLAVDQPFANHNGGMIAFGPDHMLYVGLGDGGSGGDPRGNGQNRATLLGAVLRLDLSEEPYRVPPDNPFAGQPGARGEIWAWGLRNPWRFSFDALNGDVYIADVGQNAYEEVNVAGAGEAGLNYGWNRMEGRHCFGAASCDTAAFTLPVLEYDHGQGCSITGGYVYRGAALTGAAGLYFYSDYCSGWIRSFRFAGGQATERKDWGIDAGRVLSFGRDAGGELYVLTAAGAVFRLTPAESL